jgi:hypothetical protein
LGGISPSDLWLLSPYAGANALRKAHYLIEKVSWAYPLPGRQAHSKIRTSREGDETCRNPASFLPQAGVGRLKEGSPKMPNVTIVYWRDIPAQVIVGKGRRASKAPLSERFEQAIDRAAMKIGAKDSDAYLSEWRKAAHYEVAGDPDEVAAAEAARLDAEYDQGKIKALIDNDGWA